MDIQPWETWLHGIAKKAGKEHLLAAPPIEVAEDATRDVERIREERYAAFVGGLPELYRGMTFGTLTDITGGFTAPESIARMWADTYPDVPAGLFLYSKERGTGKTHIAIAIGHVLASKGFSVGVIDVVALLNRIRNGFEDKHPRVDVERIPSGRDVLILDDLGAEKQSAWVSEQLYLLINTAISHEVDLIVTSNSTFKELGERMDDRVVSRIIGVTDLVLFNGVPDFRLEQHKRRRAV